MNHAQKIFKNTLLLTGASFLMQTVGVSFNVWLTGKLGAAGIGLFQLVMTVYGLAVTLGCGGVRLACTRLTVEREAKHLPVKKTVAHCIRYALLTGTAIAFVLFAFAPTAAKYWLADKNATAPLQALAFALPFVAMSSALNGYFTAVNKIGRYSLVRIAEQGVKIAIVMATMSHFIVEGTEKGCMAIVVGIVGSEVFSFTVLHILYNMEKQMYRADTEKFQLQELFHIAIPDVTGAGMRSILLTIEHLLIPKGFRQSGYSTEAALSIYGNIHGMVFPILLYPSAILSSLSGLLIPEIAGCKAQGKTKQITYMESRVLKLTLLFSLGTAGILFAFSEEFSHVIYGSDEAAFYMRVLAPLVPVMYCDMTVDGLLKGLDQQRASMRYNIIDSGICVILVYILLPRLAIQGYLFILFFSEILNFFLSAKRLCKVSTVNISPSKDVLFPLCCSITAPLFIKTGLNIFQLYIGTKCTLFLVIALVSCLYLVLLYGFGLISKEDRTWFFRIVNIRPAKLQT